MKKSWCIGEINAVFIAAMERILALYSLSYDPQYPVVCFDERPCFLIGDTVEPIAIKEGQVQKEHYAYDKNGSCVILAAIEPLSAKRIVEVHQHRTAQEYTQFMQKLDKQFPDAKKIRIVQDNLNTHTPASFYKHLPADQAFNLAQRFDWNYTPKAASWLNMIEIEFSALSRQCLDRRIPTIEVLKTEVLAIIKEREQKQIKINWQFSLNDARKKLNRHYVKVYNQNEKFKET